MYTSERSISPNTALKQFIKLNKQLCQVVEQVNKQLTSHNIAGAFNQLDLIEEYNAELNELKKSLPPKIELQRSNLFDELVKQQQNLQKLVAENQHLMEVHASINKSVADYLSKQMIRKAQQERGYTNTGSFNEGITAIDLPSLAIKERI